MKTMSVTVNLTERRSDLRDKRLAFWQDFAHEADPNQFYSGLELERFASKQELRLRNSLPRYLHSSLTYALRTGSDSPGKLPPSDLVQPGRLIVTVEKISYGSMTLDIGLPDVDAFVELLGNNSDALVAVFGAYFPEALNSALGEHVGTMTYDVQIPAALIQNIDSSVRTSARAGGGIQSGGNGKSTDGEGGPSAKQKGTAILLNLVQSPLILPILIVCFLWYYARQDMVAERQLTYGLVQTLVTEQTAVIGLLKDKETPSTSKELPTPESNSSPAAEKPNTKSKSKTEGKTAPVK